MRFLIARLSSLGDVVCTLPAAVALRHRYPSADITWVVDPRFTDVVLACSSVSKVVTARPKIGAKSLPTFEGVFDAAFDMQGLLKSAAIVDRARARTKLGFHWQREGSRLYSAPVRPDPTSLHVVDQYVDVVRAYGAQMNRAEFGLVPTPDSLGAVQDLLTTNGVPENFVLLNAGAGWSTKRYPAVSFASVIGGLAKSGVTPVLIGGGDDAAKDAASAVIEACADKDIRAPISLLGKTSVAELIALISLAKVHVGGDTGSTHIAAALGVPAVGLYSITRPERCCPYGQRNRTHFDPLGLDRIAPEAVLETVLEAL